MIDESNDHPSRIAVIEREDAERSRIRSTLEKSDFEVIEVTSGDELIDATSIARPDLVLLDADMPGFTGFDACKTIRRMFYSDDLPIVMLTDRDDVSSIQRAYEMGATDFLTKPVNRIVLVQRLRYILRSTANLVELRASRTRLAEAQEFANLGSWTYDLATKLFKCSDEMWAIHRRPLSAQPDEAESLIDHLAPEDRDRFENAFRTAIETKDGFSLEYPIDFDDGTRRIIHTSARPKRNDEGEVVTIEGITQDITDRRLHEEQVRFLAYHDSLTGLGNRNLLQERLRIALDRSSRRAGQVAVLFIDLDRFKRINDTLGHNAGDQLLREAADRLIGAVRGSDLVTRTDKDGGSVDSESPVAISRFGGDEFTVVLEGINSGQDAARVARRIQNAFANPFVVGDHQVVVTASMGIAVAPNDGEEAEVLMRNADVALFEAKRRGRNDFQFYRDSLNAFALEHLAMEERLRAAVKMGSVDVHFQPRLDIASRSVVGCEALARWTDEEFGEVSPSTFIPLAEETNLIVELGELILRRACEQHRAWRDAGLRCIPMSINLSPAQIKDTRLATRFAAILRETGMKPEWLEVEITETALIYSETKALVVLGELKEMGVSIALDDFGTGYSSLSFLDRFPISTVKIDRSFVSSIENGVDGSPIAEAILAMTGSLHLNVVAEGVESECQRQFLIQHGCRDAQGFLFSRPLPGDHFAEFLRRAQEA